MKDLQEQEESKISRRHSNYEAIIYSTYDMTSYEFKKM